MHRTKSFRRHQDWKHKEEVKRWMKQWGSYQQWNNPYWGRNWVNTTPQWEDPRAIGLMATTPHTCSACCGNVPREYGEVTRQEVANILDVLDSLEEIGYNSSVVKKVVTKYGDPWSYD